MRQKVHNRMAEVGKSVNMTPELGVSFHSVKKRECKRMGKRIYGIRSFAYRIRMPQPQAAYAYRVYGILALYRTISSFNMHWNQPEEEGYYI